MLAKADGTLNVSRIAHLVDQIAFLRKKGVEVVLVSSGAVAAGRAVLSPSRKTDAVSKRQLWAALGQVKLISRYSDFFTEHGLTCAQVLTTKENFSSRRHYLNMKNCMATLLENKVIPIEVKSGKAGKLRSLHQFVDRSPHNFAVRIFSGKFSVENARTISGKKYILINLPFYLIHKLKEYLDYYIDSGLIL